MSILLYSVKVDGPNPMYGTTDLVKRFGADKDTAIRWADVNGRHFGPKSKYVYVEEAEYASKKNFKKDFPLYKRHIWSAAFHGYSELEENFTTEELNDALHNLNILSYNKENWTWEQIAEFLHYLSMDRVQTILRHLQENEFISYHGNPKGVKTLKVLQVKIYE